MKKFLLQTSISVLIVIYLISKVDKNILINAFTEIDIRFYIFSTCIALSASFFKACKYFVLIRKTSLAISIFRLVKINFIARFYGLIFPTSLGPAAVRWYKVTKKKKGKSFFLASTMVERLFFLLILLFCGTIPLFFYPENLQIIVLRQNIYGLMVAAYMLLFGALMCFFSSKMQNVINHLIRKIIFIKKGSKFDQFLNNFSLKDSSFSIVGVLALLSLFWQAFFLLRIYFLFHSIHLPLTLIDALWMGSLVLLLQILPVSFAGIGLREGAYAYLFTLFGLPAEKGILIGLLFFTQMLVFSAIGAMLNIFEK